MPRNALSRRALAPALLLSCTVGTASAADAAWQPVGGPPGGTVLDLAVDPKNPQTLYAAVHWGGVWKSVDGANAWSPASVGLDDPGATTLAIHPKQPSILYVGTDRGGVFKSVDAGATWRPSSEGLPTRLDAPCRCEGFQRVEHLWIDPHRTRTVWAAVGGHAVRSLDGGRHWSTVPGVPGGSPSGSSPLLAFDPFTPGVIYAGGIGVFRSVDGGGSWTKLPGPEFARQLVVDPRRPQRVYVLDLTVLRSSTGGRTFTRLDRGLERRSLEGLAVDAQGSLFVSTDEGIFVSADGGGRRFEPAGTLGLPPGVRLPPVADPLRPGILYTAVNRPAWQGRGIYKTTDGGRRFLAARQGIAASHVATLAFDPEIPEVLHAGTFGGGLWTTEDAGRSWRAGIPDRLVLALAVDPRDSRVVYAGVRGGVFRSADRGATWKDVTGDLPLPGFGDVKAVAVAPHDGAVYAAKSDGLFRSEDGGGSWVRVFSLSLHQVTALAVAPTDPPTLWAGFSPFLDAGSVRRIWLSQDGGTSWRPAETFVAPSVVSLAVDGRDPQTLWAATTSGLQVTRDGGATWSTVEISPNRQQKHMSAVATDPSSPGTVVAAFRPDFFGRDPHGVFASRDGGANWELLSLPQPVLSLAVDPHAPGAIHAGSRGLGVVRRE